MRALELPIWILACSLSLLALPALAVEPVAVLMAIQGPVEIHRPASGVLTGAFGFHLDGGDEIVTGGDGAADVLFASGQSIHLGPKSRITIQGTPAAAAGSNDASFDSVQRFVQLRESRGTSSMARLRSGNNANELRLLAPSSAHVRGTHPQFRWAGEDEEELLLTVYSPDQVIWRGPAVGGFLQYPDDAPALTHGVRYSWVLESTDPLLMPPLRSAAAYFECLDPSEAAQVDAEVAALAKGQMSASGRAIAEASVLYGHGLLDEAITHTETMVEAGGGTELQTILAQLYVEAGRIEDALIQMDRVAHPQ